MQKPLKRVIAVEIHSSAKEKRFELFEVLQRHCVSFNDSCKQSDIDTVEKRTIGYFSIGFNDWIVRDSQMYKKPEYQHLSTTKFNTVLSLYGDEPEIYEQLQLAPLRYLYAVDMPLKCATKYHRILIKSAIHKELKHRCQHYKIRVERVFFHTPKDTDYKDATFYAANELNCPNFENLFDTQNAALCAVQDLIALFEAANNHIKALR